MSPNSSILVAYATKRGSTREVAESIAATLGERGHAVDTRRPVTFMLSMRMPGWSSAAPSIPGAGTAMPETF